MLAEELVEKFVDDVAKSVVDRLSISIVEILAEYTVSPVPSRDESKARHMTDTVSPKRRAPVHPSPELKTAGVRLLQRKTDGGVVYFIRAEGSDAIKIGFTTDLKRRIRNLECASGRKVTLLHAMPGTYDDERSLHRRFKAARLDGEWFEAVPELLLCIDHLRKGTST